MSFFHRIVAPLVFFGLLGACSAPPTQTQQQGEGPCAAVTCSGHGTCEASGEDPLCRCDVGYIANGTECLLADSSTEENGTGEDGQAVEDDDDRGGCDGVDCGNGGQCVDGESGPACACPGGYEASGLSCVATDPCTSISCPANAHCEADGLQTECVCDQGYERDGDQCVAPAQDPCATVQCPSHSHCAAIGSFARCECDAGYEKVGDQCVPEPDANAACFCCHKKCTTKSCPHDPFRCGFPVPCVP